MDEKQDVYTRVTNKIIADLERGDLTWLQPWLAALQRAHPPGPLTTPGEAFPEAQPGPVGKE